MPAVLRRLGQCAYGGDAADGLPVRGACARTAARQRGLNAPRGGGRVGERAARAERALGRARPREACVRVPGRRRAAHGVRDIVARGALAQVLSLVLSLK
jgi:hypothetical protein